MPKPHKKQQSQARKRAKSAVNASRWKQRMQSASPGAQEDSCGPIRRIMAMMADQANEWCGLPTPIEGQLLIVEPTHPASAVYASMAKTEKTDNRKVVNRWYSQKYKSDICLLRDPDGKLTWGIVPGANHVVQAIST